MHFPGSLPQQQGAAAREALQTADTQLVRTIADGGATPCREHVPEKAAAALRPGLLLCVPARRAPSAQSGGRQRTVCEIMRDGDADIDPLKVCDFFNVDGEKYPLLKISQTKETSGHEGGKDVKTKEE